MRKQESGMSPHPGRLPSSNDTQLWQKHLVLKKLQEIQRQQQLQQIDQGVRQHDLLTQVASKQSVFRQLPPLLNGMPIDASSFSLPNNVVGGNTNWAQSRGSPSMHGSNGLMFSNDQAQAVHPMVFPSQQLEQSLYGTPVSSSKDLLSQYPQFQGVANNFTDDVANQSEKGLLYSTPSNSLHTDQRVLEEPCLQSPSGGQVSGNFHQVMQKHSGWASNIIDENATTVIRPSCGAINLDPIEEKILFGGGDDEGNWGASLGSILNDNPLEGNDQLGGFPSLQSGSWSALMQEAVQATSSDSGFQEEWSGLSFQRTGQPIGNSSAIDNDNSNFQNTSSLNSQPIPFADNASLGPLCPITPSFLHSTMTASEENVRVEIDASHDSKIHSEIPNQQQNFDGGMEVQIPSNDTNNGIWSRHMYGESTTPAETSSTGFNLQSSQSIWIHQQNTPRQSDASPTGWNKYLAVHGGSTSNGHDNDRTLYNQNYLNTSMKSDIGTSNIQPVDYSNNAVMNSRKSSADHKMQQKAHQAPDASANSPSPSVSDSQTSSGLSSWKSVGPRKFQSHPMKNVEQVDSPKDTSHSQGLPRLAVQDSKVQEQGHAGHSQFVGHDVSNTRKGSSTDVQRGMNSPEESQYRSMMPSQISQDDMLKRLNMDQSRDKSTEGNKGNSDFSAQHETQETAHQSSTFQGFGLHVGSSSQQQAAPYHDLHKPSSLLHSDRRQSNSAVQSLHRASETSQKENLDDGCGLSGKELKMPEAIGRCNFSAINGSHLSYMSPQSQIQKQWQLLQNQADHSANLSFRSQADLDERVKHTSLHGQSQNLRDIAISGQSVQTSFATRSERMLNPMLRIQQGGFSSNLHDDRGNYGVGVTSELGTHSEILQQFTFADKRQQKENCLQGIDADRSRSASEEQEQMLKPHLDSNMGKLGPNQANYSLLQQMQAMKSSDSDASLKDGEQGASSHSSFASGDQLRSFSSTGNGGQSTDKTSQIISPLNYIGNSTQSLINSQMAESWLERYRKYKNGQILATHADQESTKSSPQKYFYPDVSGRIDSNTLLEQKIKANLIVPSLPLHAIGHDQDVAMKSRKRKSATSELPWHQVVSSGVERLTSISTAECDWAQATNRVIQKVEKAEMIEDGLLNPRAKRRLVLTTQLMQQLLPCMPAPILAAEVTSTYEITTYFLAKSALGDACRLVSFSGSNNHAQLDDDNRTSEKSKTVQKANDIYFSKAAESFIERSKKLQNDFSRLDRMASVLDFRVDCQELEKFSLISRLGKFHVRNQPVGGSESSATTENQNPPRKMFFQRYVTAFPMPRNIPSGVHCLLLP